MLYSKACEYAIRALVCLAQNEGSYVTQQQILDQAGGLPGPFIGQILKNLAKEGMLKSAKGPRGGYMLARCATEITLFDIKRSVDGIEDVRACVVGLAECSNEMPCPLHQHWLEIRLQIEQFLTSTTLADMAVAVGEKQRLIGLSTSASRSTEGS